MKTIQLLIDSRNGVYIPQILAKMITNGELTLKEDSFTEDVIRLANEIDIDSEWYWDDMNDLLGKLTILDKDDNEYYCEYGDCGDLFAIPSGTSIYDYES